MHVKQRHLYSDIVKLDILYIPITTNNIMLATTAFKLQVHVTVSASAIYNEWNSKLDKILSML